MQKKGSNQRQIKLKSFPEGTCSIKLAPVQINTRSRGYPRQQTSTRLTIKRAAQIFQDFAFRPPNLRTFLTELLFSYILVPKLPQIGIGTLKTHFEGFLSYLLDA